MRNMFTTQELPALLSTRRMTLGRMVKSSTMLLLSTIALLIVVLALLILFHHNINATKGYTLRSLERTRTELLMEQEVLNMRLTEAQSLGSIEQDHQLQTMVKAKVIDYAPVQDIKPEQVALRNISR